jgi:hypothetical protein
MQIAIQAVLQMCGLNVINIYKVSANIPLQILKWNNLKFAGNMIFKADTWIYVL